MTMRFMSFDREIYVIQIGYLVFFMLIYFQFFRSLKLSITSSFCDWLRCQSQRWCFRGLSTLKKGQNWFKRFKYGNLNIKDTNNSIIDEDPMKTIWEYVEKMKHSHVVKISPGKVGHIGFRMLWRVKTKIHGVIPPQNRYWWVYVNTKQRKESLISDQVVTPRAKHLVWMNITNDFIVTKQSMQNFTSNKLADIATYAFSTPISRRKSCHILYLLPPQDFHLPMSSEWIMWRFIQ